MKLHAPALLRDIGALLLPRRCIVCGCRLGASEREICTSCFAQLPRTERRGRPCNGLERLFWHRIDIVRANAFLRYEAGADSRRVVLGLKYYDRPELGEMFGRIMARDLEGTGFFDGVDGIIAVPLARKRLRKRGYNQSDMLARGVSAVTGIPVLEGVIRRIVETPTQTHLNAEQRRDNVRDIFELRRPEVVRRRHILLVDDVLTTGATLLSCAEELSRAGNVRFSVLTLSEASHHADGPGF